MIFYFTKVGLNTFKNVQRADTFLSLWKNYHETQFRIQYLSPMKKSFAVLLALFFFSSGAFAQNDVTFDFAYEVVKVFPPISITKERLATTTQIKDIDPKYKGDWVREYYEVKVTAFRDGKKISLSGNNEQFTPAQKSLMQSADVNTDIRVTINYLPENNLKNNPPKVMDFTFSMTPEQPATFPGREKGIKKYLKETTISKVDKSLFEQYKMAALTFTIDEQGIVMNPKIYWSSGHEKTDELLLNAICNMPNWQPAQYANGLKVKQDMALMVGDKESCVAYMLNTRINPLEMEK